MKISYKPLWHTLIDKGMLRKDLMEKAGFTTNITANMGKGKNINMDTLVRICEVLDCDICDVIELDREAPADKNKENHPKAEK